MANSVGNPCNVSNGNKVQSETDIQNAGLSFTRTYNSHLAIFTNPMGQGWYHNYQQSLELHASGDSLFVISGTGSGERWSKVGGIWRGDADTRISLTQEAAASQRFTLTRQNEVVETYSNDGRILSKVKPNGESMTYTYNPASNELVTVTNNYGDSLTFAYTNGFVSSVTNAEGAAYHYEYDDFDNLVAVVFPDLTPANDLDNPRKLYHYESGRHPYHLTGITDENGDRYATYAYNNAGKAVSTEHSQTTNAVGQEKIELDYR